MILVTFSLFSATAFLLLTCHMLIIAYSTFHPPLFSWIAPYAFNHQLLVSCLHLLSLVFSFVIFCPLFPPLSCHLHCLVISCLLSYPVSCHFLSLVIPCILSSSVSCNILSLVIHCLLSSPVYHLMSLVISCLQ